MSSVSSYVRTYTPDWISQFGLYRYENAECREKPVKPPRQKITLFGVLAMMAVLLFFLYIFFYDKSEMKSPNALKQDDVNSTFVDTIEITKRSSSEEFEDVTLENFEDDEINFMDKAFHNEESNHSKRIKRLDVVKSGNTHAQKLIFLPSRTLQPPKMGRRNRIRAPKYNRTMTLVQKMVNTPPSVTVSNHNMNPLGPKRVANRRQYSDTITMNPRPFGFQLADPIPSGFKKLRVTTPNYFPLNAQETQLNSIQDILNHEMGNNDPGQKHKAANKIEFTGTYRHPRKNDLTRLFVANMPTVTPTTQIQPQPYFTPAYMQNFIPDPFYNYRPSTPSDVNLLAPNQFRFAPTQNVRYVKAKVMKPTTVTPYYNSDIENMYQRIIRANNQRLRQQQLNLLKRNGIQRQKPFSLMLDVYPMQNDDEDTAPTTRPVPIRIQKPPLSAFTNQDNSYFNVMNFPQIQQQRHPMAPGFYNNMFYKNFNPYQYSQPSTNQQIHQQETAEETVNEPKKKAAPNKPSQVVVHLNLYPKNKKNEKSKSSSEDTFNKRSSREDDEVLVEKKNDTKSQQINFGQKFQTGKKSNSLSRNKLSQAISAGIKVVSGSHETQDKTIPYSINLNLNDHMEDDSAIVEHQNKSSKFNHSLDPPNKKYLYEDEDTPIIVSPSASYPTNSKKNKYKNYYDYDFTATTEFPHHNFNHEDTSNIQFTGNDYINFEHKDGQRTPNF